MNTPRRQPISIPSAPRPSAAELAWYDAVRTRNPAFDGTFYFGVRTTLIYCVPSCSSKAARPENLVFFPSPDLARHAGFRACKRCRPDEPRRPSPNAATVRAICRYIAAHADAPLTLAALARKSGYSPAYLQRLFKATVGVSPREYQDGIRLARLKSALRRGASVTGAATEAGYGSTSRLHERAVPRLGMAPSAYRAGGDRETLFFACRQTVLGLVMLAATERGVAFLEFGDTENALLAQLAQEFPKALRQRSSGEHSAQLDAWLEVFDAYLDGAAPRPDLPLDIRGTAFQVSVWNFLMTLKAGESMSYSELAVRLGRPAAARAVASACARNHIAVLIPCHRILRGDGGLGGYRWGLERKQALLAQEGRTDGAPRRAMGRNRAHSGYVADFPLAGRDSE